MGVVCCRNISRSITLKALGELHFCLCATTVVIMLITAGAQKFVVRIAVVMFIAIYNSYSISSVICLSKVYFTLANRLVAAEFLDFVLCLGVQGRLSRYSLISLVLLTFYNFNVFVCVGSRLTVVNKSQCLK